MSTGFDLTGAGFSYGPCVVLEGLTLQMTAPGMVALVGPNGAGKSTLLGVMAGLRAGYLGSCRFEGREVRDWNRRGFTRRISFVPQSLRLDFPFTAEQVVLMGRTPYAGGLFESPEDWAAVEQAMHWTDTLAFRGREFRSLSGGERQRVVLASALAQGPEVLLLDEPTTFLDLEHQLSVYRLLREQTERGLLVVAVTHDLNLALSYATRLIALKHGKLVADGPPTEALTTQRLQDVFGVSAELLSRPDGRAWIAYGD